MKFILSLLLGFALVQINAQGLSYSGTVTDKSNNQPISGATVTLVETNQVVSTNGSGTFSINVSSNSARTLQINKEGYMFEDLRNLSPTANQNIELRPKIKSAATIRWENYLENCNNYNNPNIPSDPVWNMRWTEQNFTGDLAPDTRFVRRDPTAVIEHDGKFHVWYTFKVAQETIWPWWSEPNLDGSRDAFPWDNADLMYATSTDGFNWEEQGVAVARGSRGNYDDQSVFTPEILAHDGKFYLVYQTVQFPYIERVKNTIGIAVADSPAGPWTKSAEPILRPTDNGKWTDGFTSRLRADIQGDFDSHKVHDPCLRFFNNKFYLYYKGERMGERRLCPDRSKGNPDGQREIRWGVAIADNPLGPYVKSEYNPITTSGHEVAVWNYNGGIAIIQKLDGPERGSIQFAQDGINFEMVGRATNTPEALGMFRPEEEGDTPHDGVTWGLSHHYNWAQARTTNFLARFDIVAPPKPPEEVDPPTPQSLIIEVENKTDTGGTFNDATSGGPGFGVNSTTQGVNFVNSGDWFEVLVDIPNTEEYNLIYNISTPSDNAQVQFIIAGEVLASDPVNNNGEWDAYYLLKHEDPISLTAGQHTIRILASGTNDWQWNMEKIYLEPLSSLSVSSFLENSDEIKVYPNPSRDQLTISNLKKEVGYKILNLNGSTIESGSASPQNPIIVSHLSQGAYILTLTDNSNESSSTVFIKQ